MGSAGFAQLAEEGREGAGDFFGGIGLKGEER